MNGTGGRHGRPSVALVQRGSPAIADFAAGLRCVHARGDHSDARRRRRWVNTRRHFDTGSIRPGRIGHRVPAVSQFTVEGYEYSQYSYQGRRPRYHRPCAGGLSPLARGPGSRRFGDCQDVALPATDPESHRTARAGQSAWRGSDRVGAVHEHRSPSGRRGGLAGRARPPADRFARRARRGLPRLPLRHLARRVDRSRRPCGGRCWSCSTRSDSGPRTPFGSPGRRSRGDRNVHGRTARPAARTDGSRSCPPRPRVASRSRW